MYGSLSAWSYEYEPCLLCFAGYLGRVPGPVPQKGPPKVNGVHPVPMWGARLWMWRVNATSWKNSDPVRTTRPLNILQWNTEGIYNKKVLLTDVCLFVGWLLNVPATCECISGTDLLRQVYVLPHWDRSCRSNFPSHPVTVYWHRADQSQHWPYNARRLAG